MIPVTIALVLKVSPDFGVIATSMLSLIVFLAGGFIEVITYSPMLGTSGTYLGFITGNLVNLKVPCAVNARELAGVKHGSREGEIISTISVATSTIVTTLIIAIGVAALTPLTPVLENLEDKINVIKVDIDKFEKLAFEYRIMSVPTLVFFKDGNKVKELIPSSLLVNKVKSLLITSKLCALVLLSLLSPKTNLSS